MKKWVLVFFLLLILIIGGLCYYLFFSVRYSLTSYSYKIDKKILNFSISFDNLDEESVKSLSEKAINNFEDADYRFECLVVDNVSEGKDKQKYWSVKYSCNTECSKKYINCGSFVTIYEDYTISIGYPN